MLLLTTVDHVVVVIIITNFKLVLHILYFATAKQ